MLGVEDRDLQNKIIYETMNLLLEQRGLPSAPHLSHKLQELLKKNLDGKMSFKEIERKKQTNR